MALKKSELYSSPWKFCDELRGGMDASQFGAAGTAGIVLAHEAWQDRQQTG